jgi:methionyl-tRNA synthetase
MNCAPCQREDREDGTMTMAQICAMWRNDARDLRSRAGTATDTYGTVMRARADQLGICARELALNLHTGEAQT